MGYMPFDSLPDPAEKFRIENEIGSGFCAKVFKATDLENNRTVAIKIQSYDGDRKSLIEEEYRILRDFSSYPNLPDFYGVYREKVHKNPDKIWFVLQYCEGGNAVGLVNRLAACGQQLKEEHIAFILRETAKAAMELHRNHFIHRDIRGSNILLTKDGEVKLCDFGLTREVDSTFGKRGTCIGSPCWMSPEVVTSYDIKQKEIYDSRSDVWSLGITAIELGDGKPPFADMHPTRAMFQIVRNPPPTLSKASKWSQNYNDFVTECLEKNFENRPHMLEIVEHPFLCEMIENEFALQQEIKHFIDIASRQTYDEPEEVCVQEGYLKKYETLPEKMYVEDLAAIEHPVEEIVLDHLHNRLKIGNSYSFIGDILVSLNSNDLPKTFEDKFHEKYCFKSRSENAPHIFSVADVAYQDMMHHKTTQNLILSGESYSGKSTNARLFIDHICFLGKGNKGATDRVQNAIKAIVSLTNAGTPLNNDSTRCSLQYHLTFGTTGKLSGAIFKTYLLEKVRVSTTDMNQHNFHIFYYYYDYMNEKGLLSEYNLESERNYRYLRIPPEKQNSKLQYHRDDPQGNVQRYQEFEALLREMDFSEQDIESIRKILSAILNLGNLRFKKNESKAAEFEDPYAIQKVSDMLRVEEKKFQWAMINYCKIKGGIAERKQYTSEEARDARDALSATLYQRLVDWIVQIINKNLSFPRAVFGDSNEIIVHDIFGFECFPRNGIEQLIVNTINEQMQYHYNQTIFASEMIELELDGIPPVTLNYYDNKNTLDHLLSKPNGLFSMIDEATKTGQDYDFILNKVIDKHSSFVKSSGRDKISVAHYTGKIIYDIRGFVDANRDYIPPEMIESIKTSLDERIVLMFSNPLSKSGNLTTTFEKLTEKDKQRNNALNIATQDSYSQLVQMRTLSTVFRATCLEMLKALSCKTINTGIHFVRCIRADLDYKPRNFHPDMVQQQLKAMAVFDTILARQQGYSCRITFTEFLSRYQFLAFDFDETVDVTKENCRLLLIRLKMEGWAIGKSKVFLRYYNDEFLSRLYETQVKKIIKVQSMMRSYIARRKVKDKSLNLPSSNLPKMVKKPEDPEEAALAIQKAFRGYQVRRQYGPILNNSGQIDQTTAKFLLPFAKRWKSKSLYQVLLYYRAARYQDLVHFSQQVHLYNQRVVSILHQTGNSLSIDKIDTRQTNPAEFGSMPLPLRKLAFRLEEIPYFDTSFMCETVNPLANFGCKNAEEEEPWDLPLQQPPSLTSYLLTYNAYKKEQSCQTNWDKMYESDITSNQSYIRDARFAKNGMHNEENTYYSQSRSGASNYGNHQYNENQYGKGVGYENSGSRRNSMYKKRAAPTPPPIMTPGIGNDTSWIKKPLSNDNYLNKTSNNNRPANPVREMQMKGRVASNDPSGGDDPPFNFRAMLRKTGYSTTEENNNSDGRTSSNIYGGQTNNGLRKEESYKTFSRKSAPPDSTSNNGGNQNSKNYVEEEIAPGVILKGYAFNI